MDQRLWEYSDNILQKRLEFPVRDSYLELLQTADALCLYAELSSIRPETLGIPSG
jgi:hypothetical protein